MIVARCSECTKQLHAKEVRHCFDCGLPLCDQHAYSYVDGNNIAITKNSPLRCREHAVKLESWQ